MHITRDLWLKRWLGKMQTAADQNLVLELGCDTGQDTRWLLEQGMSVVATDISSDALQKAKRAAPGGMFIRHDLTTPLPFKSSYFGVVVASLCLHYFDSETTHRAIAEVHRSLVPGGLFLCRVNSEHDVLHGAGMGEKLEPGFYRQNAWFAECKRFFGAADLDRFFSPQDWSTISREERPIWRYAAPKIAWELVLQSKG